MSFRFATQKLSTGLYEPEGIYLQKPFEGEGSILQGWGDHAHEYSEYRYNGIPLKGHNGVDFKIAANAHILAADEGRVIEVGWERGGFERYIKVEHRWGESFYAFLGDVLVDSGQLIARGAMIATPDSVKQSSPFFHFAIRVEPFNRQDGYGGFTDPTPFLNSVDIPQEDEALDLSDQREPLHPMLLEKAIVRRP
ncbi:MAG: M23 family metallopeptidase [Caldilineaceae bacterium]